MTLPHKLIRLFGWFLAATAAAAAPNIKSRAVIGHDQVVGFPETVPPGDIGHLYLKYKPWLRIYTGCVPFPAVNAEGDTRYIIPPIPRGHGHFQCLHFGLPTKAADDQSPAKELVIC